MQPIETEKKKHSRQLIRLDTVRKVFCPGAMIEYIWQRKFYFIFSVCSLFFFFWFQLKLSCFIELKCDYLRIFTRLLHHVIHKFT